jgi:hypothetical protein
MFSIKRLLNQPVGYYDYIWQEVTLLKQTPKAMLITFNNKKEWVPKAWILKIKPTTHPGTVKIRISEYNWNRKFG